MNHYELFALVSGQHADSEVEGILGQLQEMLTKHVTTIHYTQNLGRRKLGYPIKHQHHGTYVLFEFDAEPQEIKKIDRLLKLTAELLRFCLIKRKVVGKPIQLERKEEESRGPRVERPATQRRTLGEELLGDTPVLSEEPASVTAPAEIPVEETLASKEEVAEVPPSPAVSVAPEPIPEPVVAKSSKVTESDDSTPSDTAKKKQPKKASYEELDEKLNKLLSDDIL